MKALRDAEVSWTCLDAKTISNARAGLQSNCIADLANYLALGDQKPS